jgi:hypothetical protein
VRCCDLKDITEKLELPPKTSQQVFSGCPASLTNSWKLQG